MWRISRKLLHYRAGLEEETFVDLDPWKPQTDGSLVRRGEHAAGQGHPSVKERVLKMFSLLDQTDESELLPPPKDRVGGWLTASVTLMDPPPLEEEEPTEAQLAALHKGSCVLGQAPYAEGAEVYIGSASPSRTAVI